MNERFKLTDKEIVEYYYTHIEPNAIWNEESGRFYGGEEEDGKLIFYQHSGSDIHLSMKPKVLKHMKENG